MSKPLTMTVEREAWIREHGAGVTPQSWQPGVTMLRDLLAEVDALRAALAAAEDNLAEAREHAEAWESEADSANTLGQSWMAHANDLRGALEKVLPGLSFSQQSRFRSLLDDSPAASLAAHDAEVLERAALALEYRWDGASAEVKSCADTIRALAAQAQEVKP